MEIQEKRKSLHYRLLRVVAYALALAIIISGAPILLFGKFSAEKSNQENLTVIAQILAEQTGFPLSIGYVDDAKNLIEGALQHKDISKICLYGPGGDLYEESLSSTTAQGCSANYTEETESLDIRDHHAILVDRVLMPIEFQGDLVGHILIESKGQQLQQLLGAMTLAIFGSLLVALVVAFLFGSRLLRAALIDLRELRNTGRAIAKNPFSAQRAVKRCDDEVGDLVGTFNRMLDALDLENHKLKTSENTFRTLSENAPVGVFLRSSKSAYEFVNNTWVQMTGLDLERASAFADHIGSDYKRAYIEKIDSLETNNQFVVNEFEYLHEQDRDFRFLQEYVSVFKDDDTVFYIGTLIDVTELKNSQIELEKLAYFDPLTKLPNRRFLSDHLSYTFAAAEKKHDKIAVFMTDLDNFKRINDTLGHDAGDQLLSEIGSRLKNAVFKEDVVTRMGGDEFLILVDGIENLNSIEFISKRLLNAMRTESDHGISSIPVTGSIGVSIYPDDALSAEDLLRHADIALYHSKSNGGDQYSCYSEELDHAIREQIRIEQKLRKALDNNGLEVFLQPQVLADGGGTCWAEALVRWIDEEDGFISPAKFIPVAEETGLIIELGNDVLAQVCRMLRDYKDELDALGIKGISVNLSAKQFFSNTLVQDIENILKKYRISPKLIEFELTESTVTDDTEKAITIMEKLRDLGSRLSIDDFGTGYSSLSYLSKFPITSLKIDRSFVDRLPGSKHDEEIACTIINLAHNLSMTVVAEGVETEAQAAYLRDHGCEYLQGFYYAKPASITQLIADNNLKKNKRRLKEL